MRATSSGWAALAGVVIAVSGGGMPGTAHAAADDPPLVAAAAAGDAGAVRALLAAGVDVDAASVDGATALHWAVHRDLPALVRLLVDAGADASASNRYGVQPIALAATNGSAVVLEQLLDAGADPNASMPGGETALMTAARDGPPDAVRVLLRAGADPNARDDVGGQTAVMWAAARNNAPAVHALAELGADLHVRTTGPPSPPSRSYFRSPEPTSFTALLFAVRAGALDAVRALLDAGADVDDTLSDGQSALVIAAANAHWDGQRHEGRPAQPPQPAWRDCLDCYQTRPDQVRDARERDRRMAAALAAAVGHDRKDPWMADRRAGTPGQPSGRAKA